MDEKSALRIKEGLLVVGAGLFAVAASMIASELVASGDESLDFDFLILFFIFFMILSVVSSLNFSKSSKK